MRNQVIYRVNIYCTKSAIDISDQILKKVLGKLKIEQQLLNKM